MNRHGTEAATMDRMTDQDLDALLAQDVPCGDLTTELLGIAGAPGVISFAARETMILGAIGDAAAMFSRAGGEVTAMAAGGTALAAGEQFFTARGPAGALHRVWKVAQTLVEYASGIATRTRRIVDAAEAGRPGVVVACTRKNFPGTKGISIRAVRAGGAIVHRLGLSETILVFAEHRRFIADDPTLWLGRLRARAPEKKIVVEVGSVAEALAFARSGADVVQLEKLSPGEVGQVVTAVRGDATGTLVAAAGGINEANAADYAATGADVLVTSAPYFGPPADVKVILTPA